MFPKIPHVTALKETRIDCVGLLIGFICITPKKITRESSMKKIKNGEVLVTPTQLKIQSLVSI